MDEPAGCGDEQSKSNRFFEVLMAGLPGEEVIKVDLPTVN